MGSTAMIYGVALAVALVCLVAGFFWGRSNLRAQVEKAVEQEHTALDAREFAIRQQVDEAIAEVARLRPFADELSRVQERLKTEQATYQQMKAEFNAAFGGDASQESAEPGLQVQAQETTPVRESADEQIQKLLKSLEENLNSSEEPASDEMPAEQTNAFRPIEQRPSAAPAVEIRPSVPVIPEPKPIALPTAEPKPATSRIAVPNPSAPAIANPKPITLPVAGPRPSAPPAAPPKPIAPAIVEPAPFAPPVPASTPVAPLLAEKKPSPPKPASPPAPPMPVATPLAEKKPGPAKPASPLAPPMPPAEKRPGSPKSADSQPAAVDEWQEFARSLASLTGRKK